MEKRTVTSIDEYISQFPAETQKQLQILRECIRKHAPDATEIISYKMPTFYQNGNLVYFAGYKNHIGFYPSGTGIKEFQHEFGPYHWSKGAVQFPIDAPLPLKLIARIVKFRVAYNRNQAKDAFLNKISAPARRALIIADINSLKKLSSHTEETISKMHGMGPSAIKILKSELGGKGLSFKR